MTTAGRAAVCVLSCYHRLLSPLLPPACRFHPTCSAFAEQAIRRYGIRRGGWMAIRRLSSCHPFHEGGFDPLR